MNCPECSAELVDPGSTCPSCGGLLPTEACVLGRHRGTHECEVCLRPMPLRSFVALPNIDASPEVLAQMFNGPPIYPREAYRQKHQWVYATNSRIASLVPRFEHMLDAAEEGDYEATIARAADVLEIVPYHAETLLTLAHCYKELGRPADCIDVCSRVERYESFLPDVNFFQCHSHNVMGNLDAAIECGQREVMIGGLSPTTDNIPGNLAAAYQGKMVQLDRAGRSAEVIPLAYCHAVCLSRAHEVGGHPAYRADLQTAMETLRQATQNADLHFQRLGIRLSGELLGSCRCSYCESPVLSKGISGTGRLLLENGLPCVCFGCVRRLGIHVEQISPTHHRIWIEGRKLISDGQVFLPMWG